MTRRFAPIPLLVLVTLVLLSLSSMGATRAPSTRMPAPLTVHEWGTFTSVAGPDGSATDWDALGCKDDLPTFVNDFGYRGFKWRVTGTVRMETPVIYFYSQEALDARVRVTFPHGLITEWYPHADYQVYQTRPADGHAQKLGANLAGIDTTLKTLSGAIEWNNIRIEPRADHAFPLESAASRYYAARETDAAPITVGGEH